MPQVEVNYLAILSAAIFNMVLGAVWYSPLLFSKPWMELTHKKMEDIDKSKVNQLYIVTFMSAILLSYVLAHLVEYTAARTFVDGAITGFWLWIGIHIPTTLSDYLFVGRPMKLLGINSGYYFVSLIFMGGLLAVWK